MNSNQQDYAEHRASGRRSQLSARHTAQPSEPAPAVDRPLYQLTPQATKNNAFCWLSWEPQINWRGTGGQAAAQDKRNQILDEKRAAGADTLGVYGIKGSSTIDRSDMTRFVVHRHARVNAQQTSHTETMRSALRLLGPQTAAELAVVAHLDNSGLVGALLRYDIDKGRVALESGKYVWLDNLKKHA